MKRLDMAGGGFQTPLNVAAPDTKLQRIAHLLKPDIIVSAGSVGERLRAQVLPARYIDATQIMPIDQIVDPEVAIIYLMSSLPRAKSVCQKE